MDLLKKIGFFSLCPGAFLLGALVCEILAMPKVVIHLHAPGKESRLEANFWDAKKK